MVRWSFSDADWLCVNPCSPSPSGSLPTRPGLCAAAPRADGEQRPLTSAGSGSRAQSTRIIPSVNRGFSSASVTYSCQTTWVSVISFPDFITEGMQKIRAGGLCRTWLPALIWRRTWVFFFSFLLFQILNPNLRTWKLLSACWKWYGTCAFS